MKSKFAIVLVFFTSALFAQLPAKFLDGIKTPFLTPPVTNGGVGINTTTPQGALDVTSTTSGVLFPRMTTTQKNAISTHPTSMLVFDTTLGYYCYWNGSSWVALSSGQNLQLVTNGTNNNKTTNPLIVYSLSDNATFNITRNSVYFDDLSDDIDADWNSTRIRFMNYSNPNREAYLSADELQLKFNSITKTLKSKVSTHSNTFYFPDGAASEYTLATTADVSAASTLQAILDNSTTATKVNAFFTTSVQLDLPSNILSLTSGNSNVLVTPGSAQMSAANASGTGLGQFLTNGTLGAQIFHKIGGFQTTASFNAPGVNGFVNFPAPLSTTARTLGISVNGSYYADSNGNFTLPFGGVSSVTGTDGVTVASGTTTPVIGLGNIAPDSVNTGLLQGTSVGVNTGAPAAALDVVSTTDGVLVPRLTEVQRDAIVTPDVSELIFNSDLGLFQFYNGSAWATIGGNFGLPEILDNNNTANNSIKLDNGGGDVITLNASEGITYTTGAKTANMSGGNIGVNDSTEVKSATLSTTTGIALNQSGLGGGRRIELSAPNVPDGIAYFEFPSVDASTTNIMATESYVKNSVRKGVYTNTWSSISSLTIIFGYTMPDTNYSVSITPTTLNIATSNFYITNKTTTTYDIVVSSPISGAVGYDWQIFDLD